MQPLVSGTRLSSSCVTVPPRSMRDASTLTEPMSFTITAARMP